MKLTINIPDNAASKAIALIQYLKTLDFLTIQEENTEKKDPRKKNVSFTALSIDTKGFKFNRDEANER